MPGPQGVRETRPIPRRLLSIAGTGLRRDPVPARPGFSDGDDGTPSSPPPNPVSAPVHTMRAGAEPYPGTPDRHRASQSSHSHAPVQSTRQPRLPGPPVCERILTQPRSSHTEPAKPARRNRIVRANPHKPTPGTIIGKSAHVPTYATQHNGHPTIADHAKPSPHACHDIHNPTEPRAPRSPAQPTPPPACADIRNTTHHPPNHRRPRQSTPINTDDQHRSNQRRHQLISTTIPFGASLWNTLRYTSRRIYTLHVEALYWSFHGRTKCTYRTSM